MTVHRGPQRPATAPRHAAAWGVPLIGVALAAALHDTPANERAFRAIHATQSTLGVGFWSHVTVVASGYVGVCLALLFSRAAPKLTAGLVLLGVALTPMVGATKDAFVVDRPAEVLPAGSIDLDGPQHDGNAFPSGHTATAFALAALCVVLWPRRGVLVIALAGAMLMGLSRVVLGQHWPADIAAGAALGWVLGWICGHLALGPLGHWGRMTRLAVGALLMAVAVQSALRPFEYPAATVFWYGLHGLALLAGITAWVREWRRPPQKGAETAGA